MKWIKQWIKRRIEYRRRLIALWIACRYGSNNDREKAVENLKTAILNCIDHKI